MQKSDKNPGSDDVAERLPGDPGVGGLLSDPLDPSPPHDEPDPEAGPPSPAPEPPRRHGDWMPTKKPQAKAGKHRRRSKSGMPRAIFREGDGSSLTDLRSS